MEQKKGQNQMIVKYNNWLNSLSLKGLSSEELSVFMTCLAIAREHPDDPMIEMDGVDFMDLMNVKRHFTWAEIRDKVNKTHDKLMAIKCKVETDDAFTSFCLFPTMQITKDNVLKIELSLAFRFIITQISKEFTRFELAEFTQLDSKYSKNLYRQLKQFRRTRTYKKTAEEFMELMDAPVSYTTKRFMDNCLNPAVKELKEKGFFSDLKVEPIRAKRRGAPITHYEITFKPTDQIPGQQNLFKGDYVKKTFVSEAVPKEKNLAGNFGSFPQRKDIDYDEILKKNRAN